ncbi:MAG: hypothetical protein SFX74_06945 [Fimbriimonadaceae bacterium]|nr:hypothetical protein [Fimbriimonadaceae bacterium]
MRRSFTAIIAASSALGMLGGCAGLLRQPEQSGLLRSMWLRFGQEAETLTDQTPVLELQYAKTRLVELQSRLGELKNPNSVDSLRLAYVETQIAKIDAAIDLQEYRRIANVRRDDLSRLPQHSGKTKAQLQRVFAQDSSLTDLAPLLEEAQTNYEAAVDTIRIVRSRLKANGAILPPLPGKAKSGDSALPK